MSYGKNDVRYYMPLSKEGASTSVFSPSPKVNYSPETQATVKNLMRESRLTFTQKHVFDTILRNGRALPTRPEQVMRAQMRQNMMQTRHRYKARMMGIPLLEEDVPPIPTQSLSVLYGIPSRRSLDVIRASGDLEPPSLPKFYRPVNKDAEKDMLANKMAYGKVIKNSPFGHQGPPPPQTRKAESKKPESIAELKEKRIEELIDEIQDRMQFLLTMDEAKKAKEYKDFIMNQINEKLHEMRRLSPEKERAVRECLELDLFDQRLGPTHVNEHRSSKIFRR